MEDGAHPLRVALGQVVVGRDDVDASTGHRVEGRREGRDEGLALAGLHLRDLALVEYHAAHQLDVEVAHAQVPPADLPRRGEDLGQGIVEDALEVAGVALLARDAHLPPALRLGMVQLIVGGFGGRRILEDLCAQADHALTDLLVRERLELGLQAVDLVDERLQPPHLALAAAGEARQQVLHGKRKYRAGPSIGRARGPGRRATDRLPVHLPTRVALDLVRARLAPSTAWLSALAGAWPCSRSDTDAVSGRPIRAGRGPAPPGLASDHARSAMSRAVTDPAPEGDGHGFDGRPARSLVTGGEHPGALSGHPRPFGDSGRPSSVFRSLAVTKGGRAPASRASRAPWTRIPSLGVTWSSPSSSVARCGAEEVARSAPDAPQCQKPVR